MARGLYTTLVHSKAELTDGRRPLMELSEEAKEILDPDLVPGMGILVEDEDKGLRCPVRGCGGWYHVLSSHLTQTHADIGGADRVREVLSLHPRAGLVSQQYSAKMIAVGRPQNLPKYRRGVVVASGAVRRKAGKSRSLAARTVGVRNLRNSCEAQMIHRLLDLESQVGRHPSKRDSLALDPKLVGLARRIYGGWDAFKALAGLSTYTPEEGRISPRIGRVVDKEAVTECFGEFYKAHGRFPTTRETHATSVFPLVPSYLTIRRVFGRASWKEIVAEIADGLEVKV